MDKPEFRSIGNPTTTSSNTLGERDGTISASNARSSDTEITGLRPDGSSPGVAGSIRPINNSTVAAALLQAPGRDIRALLPKSVDASLVTAEYENVLDALHVASPALELKAVPPENDVLAARVIIDESLEPAGKPFALKFVGALMRITRPGDMDPAGSDDDEDGDDALLVVYEARCAEYPPDILGAFLYDPPEFFPALRTLVQQLDALIEPRRNLRRALSPEAVARARERLAAEAEQRRREAEWRPPTEEEKAHVSEIVSRLTEKMTGAASSGITDRRRSTRTNAFCAVLATVNAAAPRLGGTAAMEAWELVAAAHNAGSFRAMAPDARKKLHELYRMAKSARVKPVAS